MSIKDLKDRANAWLDQPVPGMANMGTLLLMAGVGSGLACNTLAQGFGIFLLVTAVITAIRHR